MRILSIPLLCLTFLLSGCSLMSSYDATTDQGITDVHRKLIAHIPNDPAAVDPPGITPEQAQFYHDIEVEVASLKVRAQAIPQNKLTVDQLTILQQTIQNLETFDKWGYSYLDAKLIRDAVDRCCGAILKLELAKKRLL